MKLYLNGEILEKITEIIVIGVITIFLTYVIIKINFFTDDIVGKTEPGYIYGENGDICFTGCYSK